MSPPSPRLPKLHNPAMLALLVLIPVAACLAILGGAPARRTAVTAAATYSGRFMRPSIFTEQTPAASRERTWGMKDISFRDRA